MSFLLWYECCFAPYSKTSKSSVSPTEAASNLSTASLGLANDIWPSLGPHPEFARMHPGSCIERSPHFVLTLSSATSFGPRLALTLFQNHHQQQLALTWPSPCFRITTNNSWPSVGPHPVSDSPPTIVGPHLALTLFLEMPPTRFKLTFFEKCHVMCMGVPPFPSKDIRPRAL
jgi:hypothetical protein